MTLLELKQQISRLSEPERDELRRYLGRLQLESPATKQRFADAIQTMKLGNYSTQQDLESRVNEV